MKTSILVLFFIFLSGFISAQYNGGFEFVQSTCSHTPINACNNTAQISAFYDECLALNSYEGWFCASGYPLYQYSGCTDEPLHDWNAYEGDYFALITGGGESGNNTIFYQFSAPTILAGNNYTLSFHFLVNNSENNEPWYLYVIGSNDLVNSQSAIDIADLLTKGSTILTEAAITTTNSDLYIWHPISLMLVNSTETDFSQLLFYVSLNQITPFGHPIGEERDVAIDQNVGIDSFGQLQHFDESCCLVPLIYFDCNTEGRDIDKPVCAHVDFYSPCNEMILPDEFFDYTFSGNLGPHNNCDYYGGSMDLFVLTNALNQDYSFCFEDETNVGQYVSTEGGNAQYSFTLPDNTEIHTFCDNDCDDLIATFTYTSLGYSCPSNTLFGTTPYRKYVFTNTSSYGNESIYLYHWEFNLFDGSVIYYTGANPPYYYYFPNGHGTGSCSISSGEIIHSPITMASLTLYSLGGCKGYSELISIYPNISPIINPKDDDNFVVNTNQGDEIKLISNIVSNELSFVNSFSQQTPMHLCIFSTQGDEYLNVETDFKSGEKEKIQVQFLSPGFYMIHVYDSKMSFTIPFVKI